MPPPTAAGGRRSLPPGLAPSSAGRARNPTDLNKPGFVGRFLSDIGTMGKGIFRAGGEIVGAIGSDTVMRLGRALVPGGSTGFDYGVQTWDSVLKPMGESVLDTATLVARDLPVGLPAAALRGMGVDIEDEAADLFWDRWDQFQQNPGLFAVEHVGNVALTGAVAARPLGAAARSVAGTGGATRATAQAQRQAARQAAMFEGRTRIGQAAAGRRAARGVRRQSLQELVEQGGPGSRLARASQISGDVIGHPYVQIGRRVADTRLPNLGAVVGGTGLLGRFADAPRNHSLREVAQQVREAVPLDRMEWTSDMRDAATLRRLREEASQARRAAEAAGDGPRAVRLLESAQEAAARLADFETANASRLGQLETTRLAPPLPEELASPAARATRQFLNHPATQAVTAPAGQVRRGIRKITEDAKRRRSDKAFERHVANNPEARRTLTIRQLRDLDGHLRATEQPSLADRGIDLDRRGWAPTDEQLFHALERISETPELRDHLPRLEELDRTMIDLYERINDLPDGSIRDQLYHDATLTPEVADTVRRVQRAREDLPPDLQARVDEALGRSYRMPDEQLANPLSDHPQIQPAYDRALRRLREQAAERDVTMAQEGLSNPETWAARVADDGQGGVRPMTPDESPTLRPTPSKQQAQALRRLRGRVTAARTRVDRLTEQAQTRGLEAKSTAARDYRRAVREQQRAQRKLEQAQKVGDQKLADQLRKDLAKAQAKASRALAEQRRDVFGETQRAQRDLEQITRDLAQADLPVGAAEELGAAVRAAREALDDAFAAAEIQPTPRHARSIDDLDAAAVDVSATDAQHLDNLIRLAESSPEDLAVWRDAISGASEAIRDSRAARRNVSNVERLIRAEERAKAHMRNVERIQRRLESAEGRVEARDVEVLRAAEEAVEAARLEAQRIAEEAGVSASPETPGQVRRVEDRLLREQTRATGQLAELRRAQRSLDRLEATFSRAEAEMRNSIDAAPAVARPVLQVSRAMQDVDRALRDTGFAHVADDLRLTELPTTLDKMNDAGVSPTFLRRIEDRLAAQGYRASREQVVQTTTMSAQRRRGMADVNLVDDLDQVKLQSDLELAGRVIAGDVVEEVGKRFGRSMDEIGEMLIERGVGVDGTPLNREAWRDMTKGQRERLLQEHGFNQYTPDSIFSFRVRRTHADGTWIPTYANDALRTYMSQGPIEKVLAHIVGPATTTWKHAVLALRPAWHLYNIVGGAAMATVGGGMPIMDYLEFMRPGGEARTLLRAHRMGHDMSRYGLTPELATQMFDQALARDILPNQRMRETLSDAMTQPERMREVMQSRAGRQVGRVRQRTQQLIGASYRANAYMDNLHRSALYLYETLQKGTDPAAAVAQTGRVIGDYTTMNHLERTYIRNAVPFYAWMRHITKLSADMMRADSITRTTQLGTIVHTLGVDLDGPESLLPEYMQGNLRIPGTDIYIGTRGLNPWSDILEAVVYNGEFSLRGAARSLHPLAQFTLERRSGIDTLTGRPFSRPVPVLDDLGREVPTPPPFLEHAFQSLAPPQLPLARDLFRVATGQTTARYSTGEPVLVDGVREPSAFAGLGAYFGMPLRFPDLEGVQDRREAAIDRGSRALERYRLELEAYERQRSERSLPERLIPFYNG